MTTTADDANQTGDASDGMLEMLVKAALWLVLVLVCAPLVIPFIVRGATAMWAPTKRWYWATYRWWWIAVTGGIVAVVAMLAVEAWLVLQWADAGGYAALTQRDDRFAAAWAAIWPWLIVNTAAGVLLVPAVWSARRRKVAEQVRKRTISDVVRQEKIEAARHQAKDLDSARRIGVKVDAVTKTITGSTGKGITAPHPLGNGEYALGVINRDTIQSMAQLMADRSRVPDWVTGDNRYLILPTKAGATRLLLFSESGTGKTVLLMNIIAAAVKSGVKVVFIDAKGVPSDARALAALVAQLGRTAVISGKGEAAATRWNLFHGSAADVTAKLMRLQPPPAGANEHYLQEIEAVLTALQHAEPVRGVQDLQERAERIDSRDRYDHRMLAKVVNEKSGETAAERAVGSVVKSLRRFEGWIDEDGWTFDDPEADVTICPLIPVDPTQAALGDLLLLELRSYIARRLEREDYSPVLVIVDEFPSLVTPGNDPADVAAPLFETLRSAGGGLILAGQNVEGFSPEPAMRARVLNSGAAIAFGRQKSPKELVDLAGTELRMEASGAATGEELKSGRAQHTYRIKPQDVREASAAQFWIVQGGSHAAFRALPNASADATATPEGKPVEDQAAEEIEEANTEITAEAGNES
ncbi:ATP-binding protein [Microbacterium sp. ISL-59]|uniref:ATP-binding protein n=1 Tax=Microbacterium sp. ISL-59 TaxID=2819159 RepID=UPI001BE9B89A|nr:ATP-binding protein [Microbacterium sp. ISL-59]MBT2497467.1 ATP-binding protein [Microbacterium sp. ISL-59]